MHNHYMFYGRVEHLKVNVDQYHNIFQYIETRLLQNNVICIKKPIKQFEVILRHENIHVEGNILCAKSGNVYITDFARLEEFIEYL